MKPSFLVSNKYLLVGVILALFLTLTGQASGAVVLSLVDGANTVSHSIMTTPGGKFTVGVAVSGLSQGQPLTGFNVTLTKDVAFSGSTYSSGISEYWTQSLPDPADLYYGAVDFTGTHGISANSVLFIYTLQVSMNASMGLHQMDFLTDTMDDTYLFDVNGDGIDFLTAGIDITVVPEPGSIYLLFLGLFLLVSSRYQVRKNRNGNR